MPDLEKLLRVIPVNETVDTDDGWATLASVELWEGGVQLRVSAARMPDPFRGDLGFPRERVEWHVSDDLGTSYTWEGGAGGGGGGTGAPPYHGNAQFSPEVPPTASKLLIFAPVMRIEQPIEVTL